MMIEDERVDTYMQDGQNGSGVSRPEESPLNTYSPRV